MHEKWDVEAFTMGTAMSQNFYINQLLPFFWMKGIDSIKALQKKEPTLKQVLDDKLKARYEQTNTLMVNRKTSLDKAKKDAT